MIYPEFFTAKEHWFKNNNKMFQKILKNFFCLTKKIIWTFDSDLKL